MASPLTSVIIQNPEENFLPPLESTGKLGGRNVKHISASHGSNSWFKSCGFKVLNSVICLASVGLIIGGAVLHATEEDTLKKYSGMAMWVSGVSMIGVQCCNLAPAVCCAMGDCLGSCLAFK